MVKCLLTSDLKGPTEEVSDESTSNCGTVYKPRATTGVRPRHGPADSTTTRLLTVPSTTTHPKPPSLRKLSLTESTIISPYPVNKSN